LVPDIKKELKEQRGYDTDSENALSALKLIKNEIGGD